MNPIKRTALTLTAISLTCLALGAFIGCESTPAAWESKFYEITTNVTPQVIFATNQVFRTNIVERTEVKTNWESGIPQIITQPLKETVITSEATVTVKTNVDVSYTYRANTNAAAVGSTAGSIANLIAPGTGGLVTTAIAGLAALWGGLRSRKLKKTAGVLAQGIEVYGEVTKAMGPVGEKADSTVKGWMQKHQAEAGVLTEVLDLLDKTVDESDAKDAATALRKVMA